MDEELGLTRARKLLAWLEDHWEVLTSHLVIVAIAGLGHLGTSETFNLFVDPFVSLSQAAKAKIQTWSLIVAAVLVVVEVCLVVIGLRKAEKLSVKDRQIAELRQDNNRLATDNQRWSSIVEVNAEHFVGSLATEVLGFGTREVYSERITLYIHDPSGFYIPVGRFSRNGDYRATRRNRYPAGEGCIAFAWRDGVCFDNEFPDWDNDRSGYLDRCRQYGLKKEVVKRFTMKSRLYFSLALTSLDGGRRNLAVLVVESTDPNRYTREELEFLITAHHRVYLSHLAEKLVESIPKVLEADRSGL